MQLAEGLHAAHRAGIVHADFKSANVILVPARIGVRAVITDFGVARRDPASHPGEDTYVRADTIRVAGTLAYMSPEQLAGDRVTTASDIYSFGIVLFEMACGERPFDDSDLIKSAMLRAGGPAVSVRTKAPGIDERWEAAIARCLQRDPERRFHSAGELANWFREPLVERPLLHAQRPGSRGGGGRASCSPRRSAAGPGAIVPINRCLRRCASTSAGSTGCTR